MLPTCPLSYAAPHCRHLDEALARGGSDGGGGGGVEGKPGALEEEVEEGTARQEREAMAEAAEQLQRQMTEVLYMIACTLPPTPESCPCSCLLSPVGLSIQAALGEEAAQAGAQAGPQPVLISVGGIVPPPPSPPPAPPDEGAMEAAEEEERARAEAAAEFGLDGAPAGLEGARSRSMHDLFEQRAVPQPLAELEMAADTAPAAC